MEELYAPDETIKLKLFTQLADDPSFILLLKNKYITDDLWMFCIEREPSLFKHMKNPSVDMCLFALEQDGHNLKYIRNKFKDIKITKKMIYMALSNCPKSIFYAPKEMLDEGLKELAFDTDPSLMRSFDVRPEYIRKKVNENPLYIKYVKNPDEDLVCEILSKEPNTCVYFDKWTPRMIEIIREKNPELLNLYQYRDADLNSL